jgi:hypothetical protein
MAACLGLIAICKRLPLNSSVLRSSLSVIESLASLLLIVDLEDFGGVIHLWEVILGLLELLSLLPVPFVNLVAIEPQFLGNFLGVLLVPFWVLLKISVENINLLLVHQVVRVEDWLLVTPFRFVNYLIDIICDVCGCLNFY